MRSVARAALVVVIAVVMLVAVPGALANSSSHPSSGPAGEGAAGPSTVSTSPAPAVSAHATAPATGSTAESARGKTILSALHSDGVPDRFIHLPDLAAEGDHPGRQVGLTYANAPAPMGVSDIGLRNVSGSLSPYVLNTTSAEGSITFTNAQSMYVDGDGPDMFGVQLNSVVTNVTLFGDSTYQFWTQNFVSYTSSSGELSFGDNIWNFSSPDGLISSNVFYQTGPNGSLVAPIFYYAIGPTYTVHYPFTVQFFLNSTILDDRPAVFFNYSVASSTVNVAGSFDYVIFNSSVRTPTAPAPVAQFQINGEQTDPIGLVNDIELDVVGNDDGDTTTFYAMQATLAIAYWNETDAAYAPVPSAFDTGVDTGETSNGVYDYYTTTGGVVSPVAHMVIGPSFLRGLWNVSSAAGVRSFEETQTPANAFLFVTPGATFNVSTAQWVPTIPLGAATSNFGIPNDGTPYFFEWMLSDYRAAGAAFDPAANSTTTFARTLVHANAAGLYTPLLAWGNAELASISSGGTGTAADPYILVRNQADPLNPVFSQWNDFQFPVFAGLLLVDTTDYVTVTPSSFYIVYPAGFSDISYSPGLPGSNNLQLDFAYVSNVSLVNAPSITGWFSWEIPNVYPFGNVIFWNSSGNLISGNTFNDQGSALVFYGGTNNTVWGNRFLETPVATTDPTSLFQNGNTTGLYESESGDLVYNNYFDVTTPAYSPTFDPLLCQIECEPGSFVNTWNVSLEPANVTATALGATLTGSIIGTWYQGGNYWSNYGTPSNPYGPLPLVTPYNDSGWIAIGGDFVPLVPNTLYPVTFNETGLATGTAWNVTVIGVTTASTTSSLTVYVPNGTGYAYLLPSPAGYVSSGNGAFDVDGAPVTVTVAFAPLEPVTFAESGLVPGWTWSVFVLGPGSTTIASSTTNGTWQVIDLPGASEPVSYSGSATAVGYANAGWSTSVGLGPARVAITFATSELVTFVERGLASGSAWTIHLTQGTWSTSQTSSGSAITFSSLDLGVGPLNFSASATNYTASPAHGTYSIPGTGGLTVFFSPVNGSLSVKVSPLSATFAVDGKVIPLTSVGLTVVNLVPGVHSVEVNASGYLPYFNNVSVRSNSSTSLNVSLTSVPSTPAPAISSAAWAAIGLLAALAVVFLLLALAYRSRGRRPPPKPVAPAMAPAASTPSTATSPSTTAWKETPEPEK